MKGARAAKKNYDPCNWYYIRFIFSHLAAEESELISSPRFDDSIKTPRNSTSAGIPSSQEGSSRRKSSRFKRLKHKFEMTLSLQQSLADELEQARDTITGLGERNEILLFSEFSCYIIASFRLVFGP